MLLNIDLGEQANEPDELYDCAQLVNVACGGHAGDADSMQHACERARATGARLGAHPSYEDRARFGRVSLALTPEEVRHSVAAQCRTLAASARNAGVGIHHVKPHGALYHDASRDPALAAAVVDGMLDALGPVAIVGPPGSRLADEARARGLVFLAEGFADRAYQADGSLVPRTQPGALLESADDVTQQVRRLVAERRFDTLCVHSDTPGAVALARAVRAVLVPA